MRLLLASMAVLVGCGSSGRPTGLGLGGFPGGGAGGGPASGAGVSPDTGDALVIVDAGDAADAQPTFSCQLTAEAGVLTACIELDPGYPTPSEPCAASGAGPVMIGACARLTSSGGCHVAEKGMDSSDSSTTGYTVWWYPPLGTGAVLARCEQTGDSYVSP